MFENHFSHYLSYGASDQETALDLRKVYDGLLVPGTVAAFQKEGTGGFVLSLSASAQIPYVIDPRSPLFQQVISAPKKSHKALAGILGLPDKYSPKPELFTPAVVAKIAENWVKFNSDYQSEAGGKFAKYAERLGEKLDVAATSPPHVILSPYFVANATSDAWWKVTSAIYDATCAVAAKVAPNKKCVRVVATEQALVLDHLCSSLSADAEIILWVSDLNEIRAPALDLIHYGRAVEKATARGQMVFGLYGGFFSVLLGTVGLQGISHGIGYGESRNWVELPQSGPPPQRYYVESFHRYVSQELAEQLWKAKVYRCACPICASTTPLLLEYHDVMKHSVYCRQNEIHQWTTLTTKAAIERLRKEYGQVAAALTASTLPDIYRPSANDALAHLPGWISALSTISSGSS